MWIQVRTFDGKQAKRVDGLSKLSKIEDLRERLVDVFDATPDRQRLFFRGKQLEDGHSLFDYNVGLNEIIQIMIRPAGLATKPKEETKKKKDVNENGESSGDESVASDKENQKANINQAQQIKTTPKKEIEPVAIPEEISEDICIEDCESTYKLGDLVDVRDPTMGAWFEAKITKISKNSNDSEQSETEKSESTSESHPESNTDSSDGSTCPALKDEIEDDGFLYHIIFESYEDDDEIKVPVKNVRPRARHKIPLKNIEIGSKVMVNFNYDDPDSRGYWYDAIVTSKRDSRSIKILTCTVYLGADLVPMENCNIWHYDEVFSIEKAGTQLNTNTPEGIEGTPVKRKNKPECDHCKDNPKKKCKHCACHQCGGKDEPEKTIMCDECDNAYHLRCLDPPLTEVPDVDEWYCPMCKNDENEVVRAGEKLKESKKKSKMASATTSSSRDWGRGMACAGRTKECRIVPPNHFGTVPGIEVGMQWKFRVQVSEVGCHRPHVAGIHGREDEGAYSIVLSGGYEDDVDDGDEFTYTGSGGRDLSGNKRTAEQSCDQTLTRMNRALAKNCNAPLDNKKGAEAKDWQGGKPVRVVRNCKGRKHSKYAPEEGNRYDGIYKIVKYWPARGKSGFLVWRYLLKRDDPVPAPWTKAGKKRMEQLGLSIQYPEGYLESQKEKEKEKESTPGQKKGKRGKRKRDEESSDEESDSPAKKKVAAYKLSKEASSFIKEDEANKKLWEEAVQHTKEGGQKFLAKVEELFMCICCQDLAFKPITIKCSHNVCKPCLSRSFRAEVYSCPACRYELGKNYSMATNKPLSSVLNLLFPGYEHGR